MVCATQDHEGISGVGIVVWNYCIALQRHGRASVHLQTYVLVVGWISPSHILLQLFRSKWVGCRLSDPVKPFLCCVLPSAHKDHSREPWRCFKVCLRQCLEIPTSLLKGLKSNVGMNPNPRLLKGCYFIGLKQWGSVEVPTNNRHVT